MGKKKKKYRATELARKKPRLVKPDDYLRLGSIEVLRSGKFVIFRNNMSKEEFASFQIKSAEHLPEICNEIDGIINDIVSLVSSLSPTEILKRGYWENVYNNLYVESECEATTEGVISLRMIDYLQSIIVSIEPKKPYQKEITKSNWEQLKKLIKELFSRINFDYQVARTAHAALYNENFNMDHEEYYFKAQVYWCNIRGHRPLVHQIPHLLDILSPHGYIFFKLYGISIETFINELSKVAESLSTGVNTLFEELKDFQRISLNKIEEKIKAGDYSADVDPPALMSQVVQENKWEAWQESILGRFLGLDLFDLSKITVLPETILSDLSWEPGENDSFFGDGEFRGWPLKIWPIFERPFIKIDDRYYCFDLYSLFDNIYRAIQRLVIKKYPEYKEDWNIKQKEMSEEIPFNLLNKILPEATIYRSNYFRWSSSLGGKKEWHENDGLVIYGDHLFVVEIKAGAFTYTPPATDFPAYLKSIENLILKPTEQGTKFLKYLQSNAEITIYDENHQEKMGLSRRDFKHITVCAITLDPITEIASQTEHLKRLNMNLGDHPVWSVSVDDLRAYSDIFENPLIFLHYIEQRNRAQKSEAVKVNDELDHLGLYFTHNNYSRHATESALEGDLQWLGYRKNIDKYFAKHNYQDRKTYPPRQSMPPRLRELIDTLYRNHKTAARRVVSLLLDFGGKQRDNIAQAIDSVLSVQRKTLRPKPFSIYGHVGLTIFCWQNGVVTRNQRQAVDHAMAVAFAGEEPERLLLELQFDSMGNIVSADFQFVNLLSLSDTETKHIKEISKLLVDRRLAQAGREGRGIGRNQPCPCGSGKKFKKCCMKRGAIH